MREFHVDANIPSTPDELNQIIESLKDLAKQSVTEDWFKALSKLQCLFNDAWFSALWHYNQDTSAQQPSEFFNTVIDKFVPRFEEVFTTLNEIAQQADVKSERYTRIVQRMNRATFESSVAIELSKQINLMAEEYEKLASQQVVDVDGTMNLKAANKLLQRELDSERRKDIWLKIQHRKTLDAAQSETIMMRLLDLRNQLAAASGDKDFRSYCWRKKERDGYTPDDNLALLSSVEETFATTYLMMARTQMQHLGLTDYRPWDSVAPIDPPQLVRQLTEDDYLALVQRAFSLADAEFGEIVNSMIAKGHVDLTSRPNKAAYNYCGTFFSVNEPAVSCNLTGDLNQLNTAFHEFGHAMHHFYMNPGKLYFEKGAPDEISEFAATTFQLLGYDALEQIDFTPQEARHYRYAMLVNKLNLVREISALDRLQHWIFTRNTEPEIQDINDMYIQLTATYPENWTGYENYKALGWHHDHVISAPFYTVEYVISWIGALIYFRRYKEDANTLETFKSVMRLGNTVDTVAAFGALGIRFPFRDAEVKEAKSGLDNLLLAL